MRKSQRLEKLAGNRPGHFGAAGPVRVNAVAQVHAGLHPVGIIRVPQSSVQIHPASGGEAAADKIVVFAADRLRPVPPGLPKGAERRDGGNINGAAQGLPLPVTGRPPGFLWSFSSENG